ncbi:hypothetical protein ABFS82_10G028600 [Erythranthe guttata]|uniref:Uncharacterized protein n=1 Tax=Erythranthe guttata TaxID=4155 RepID=A0A022RP39_ERYGU|nr:PREDICTED: uncharacterized protein LOC105952794 [Erythranthe guttata]EYU41761.1 hypothetical protein MIMGU_mgv1a017291mg [Erythranthe guttata]|eukprot:XP_012831825.1 PREDICTED: uncharacterized protein LOC105952794 [Erythranthe guttata]
MEGLIPFVYKAIVQYKNGGRGTWLNESPSASYMRIPAGDSGRFSTSDIQLSRPDYCAFSASSPPRSAATRVLSGRAAQSGQFF